MAAEPVAEPEPVTQPDATARLDAAVERANAGPWHPTPTTSATPTCPCRSPPTPCAARPTCPPRRWRPARRPVPRRSHPSPTRFPLRFAAPQTIYVQAPTPPKARGNRGFGVLVALIGTVAFAAALRRHLVPAAARPGRRGAGELGVHAVRRAAGVLGADRRHLRRLRAARRDREPRAVVVLRRVRAARRRAGVLLVHRRRAAHGRGVDADASSRGTNSSASAGSTRSRSPRRSWRARSRSGSAAGSRLVAARSPSATASRARPTTASSPPARSRSASEPTVSRRPRGGGPAARYAAVSGMVTPPHRQCAPDRIG